MYNDKEITLKDEKGDLSQSFDNIGLLNYISTLIMRGTYVLFGSSASSEAVYFSLFTPMEKFICEVDSYDNAEAVKQNLALNNINDEDKFDVIFQQDSSECHMIEEECEKVSILIIDRPDINTSHEACLANIFKSSRPVVFLEQNVSEEVVSLLYSYGYKYRENNVDKSGYLEMTHQLLEHKKHFDVGKFWDKRYSGNKGSGAGSYNRLAEFKAKFINNFVKQNDIKNVLELGCGDGAQLSLGEYNHYVGLDISPVIISKCNEKFLHDKSKEFHVYIPESFESESFTCDLSLSLDVVYHLSNDAIYEKYLKDLFSVSNKYVIIYSINSENYMKGLNENASHVRLREFLKDVQRDYPEWVLIDMKANAYPYNPSLGDSTSIADFFVFEKNANRQFSDYESFKIEKNTNLIKMVSEQVDAKSTESATSLKEIENHFREFLAMRKNEIASLDNSIRDMRLHYEEEIKSKHNEIENLKLVVKLSKEFYERTLADYVGSRTKYKRLSEMWEKRYYTIHNSTSFKLGETIVSSIRRPGYNTLALPYRIMKIGLKLFMNKKLIPSNNNSNTAPKEEIDLEELRRAIISNSKLETFISKSKDVPVTIIYGDISLNIVDGSSVWFSSVYNVFSKISNVIVISKQDVVNDLITSNFLESKYATLIVSPELFGLQSALSTSVAAKIIEYLDDVVQNVQNVVVRGMSAATCLSSNNTFKGRLLPYLTDFYLQSSDGTYLKTNATKEIQQISHIAKLWLWQTPEMEAWVYDKVGLKNQNSLSFPPILPDIKITAKKRSDNCCLIGYAGKIQPDWGVVDLIEEVCKLRSKGMDIRIRIITSKISSKSTFQDGAGFIEKMNDLLKYDFIEVVRNVNREKTIKLLSDVDFIWSYRPGEFESTTLELSTKIIEAIALNKKTICYPGEINKRLLGEDYKYFLTDVDSLEELLTLDDPEWENNDISEKVIKEFSLEERVRMVSTTLENSKPKMITFAGNDFKFIDHFYSHLKATGYNVVRDRWEWGEAKDIENSKSLLKKSDIIFCEWGLENAVWYSNNKQPHQKLYIRIHAQEVREKARKFGRKINAENVDKFIFVSERIRKKALELFGWPEEKTVITPNYVLTDDFNYSEKAKLSPTIGIVGIIPQSKRFDLAVDMLIKLLEVNPNAKLHVKGYKPDELEWMKAPGRKHELEFYDKVYNKINSNVVYTNAIIYDGFGNDMPEWYKKIDFIISPSDHESFHYALADGVSAGCIPLLWPWENAEKVYSPDWIVMNTNEAVDKVNEYLNLSKEEVNKLREKNRKLICDRYSYKNIYEKLKEIIEI